MFFVRGGLVPEQVYALSIVEMLDLLGAMADRADDENDRAWQQTLFTIQAIENTRLKHPKKLDHKWKEYRAVVDRKSVLTDSPESIRERIRAAHEAGLNRERQLRGTNGDSN